MCSKRLKTRLLISSLLCLITIHNFIFYARAETIPTTISINKDVEIISIPELAFGMNMAVFDRYATDANIASGPRTSDLLRDLQPAVVRWPGGTYSDAFHWKGDPGIRITDNYGDTNIIYYAPNITTPDVINEVNGVGSQMMITVNYGTGTADEAADWVEYSNISHNYKIKYWEIGNETYADGTYSGWNWEPNSRSEKGPIAYGVNALDYIDKMKAIDPSIKIGVVLDLTQGNADNGICTPTECIKKWNHDVLTAQRVTQQGTEILGEKADFVVIHWYPECPKIAANSWCTDGENDTTLLEKVNQINNIVQRLKDQIAEYVPDRPNIPIFVTETNSVSQDPGKQTVGLVNAMFLADSYMTWLKNGISNVDWWVLHAAFEPNNNNSDSLFGDATFGNLGMIASEPYKGISSPTFNTPFPPYYGFKMLRYLGSPGDKIISSSSGNSLITTHAVKQRGGNIALLVINKDPQNSYNASISIPGYNSANTATAYKYDKVNAATINVAVPINTLSINSTGGVFNYILSPYSLNTLIFTPYITPTPTTTPGPTDSSAPTATPTPHNSSPSSESGNGSTIASSYLANSDKTASSYRKIAHPEKESSISNMSNDTKDTSTDTKSDKANTQNLDAKSTSHQTIIVLGILTLIGSVSLLFFSRTKIKR